jgi:hypothetical protein
MGIPWPGGDFVAPGTKRRRMAIPRPGGDFVAPGKKTRAVQLT